MYNYYFHIDKPSIIMTPIQQRITFVCYVPILMLSAFVSVVTRFSRSEAKPWPLLLLMLLLDMTLLIFELMLDIGLVIILDGKKRLGMGFLGIRQYFVTMFCQKETELLPTLFFWFSSA